MSLETYTGFTNALVTTNPAGTAPKSQGDDHLRGIKKTIVDTLGSLDGPFSEKGTAAFAISGPSGSAFGFRNKIINGGCQVAQRASANLVNDTHVYGAADRFAGFVSAATVTAGTMIRGAAGSTISGQCVGMYLVSTTGTSALRIQQRIESLNSYSLNGKTVTVSGKIYQNTGSTVNMQVQLLKPNSSDTWPTNGTGTTQVGSTVTVSCASGSWVSFSGQITVGSSDASGGLAVSISTGAISAVTSKEFYIGDLQLEEGSVATPFEARDYGDVLRQCQRYYEKSTGSLDVWSGAITSGESYYSTVRYVVTKRNTAILEVSWGSQSGFPSTNPVVTVNVPDGFACRETANATQASAYYIYNWAASAEL